MVPITEVQKQSTSPSTTTQTTAHDTMLEAESENRQIDTDLSSHVASSTSTATASSTTLTSRATSTSTAVDNNGNTIVISSYKPISFLSPHAFDNIPSNALTIELAISKRYLKCILYIYQIT